jgi:hypothetical protein
LQAPRDKREHLARYVARPPVATEWLSLPEGGLVQLALKTPYRDGTTHVIFEPADFIARLVALVPKPRAHLTRYHGVFAPASPDRSAAIQSRPIRQIQVGRRPRAICWFDRFVIPINTIERRGRGCFAGKVASIGRDPRGFSLP